MEQNLTIKNQNGVMTIDSREVAKMMGKEHSKLLRDIRTYCGYLAEANFGLGKYFIESTYLDFNNQERPCYLITKMGCEMCANKMTGKKGIIFTAKYVEKFNKMEQYIKQENQFKLPQTYKEALLQLVEQVEQNEKLQEENKKLKPKAEDYNRLISADNNQTMNQVAKSLKVGRNKLFEFLRDKDVLMKSNMPYQRYIDNGCFVVREFTKVIYGTETNMTQTLVTAKGIDFINKLLKKINYEI